MEIEIKEISEICRNLSTLSVNQRNLWLGLLEGGFISKSYFKEKFGLNEEPKIEKELGLFECEE